MKTFIEINGLPRIQFAHSLLTNRYRNTLPAMSNEYAVLEISYISEGELNIILPDERILTAPTHSVVCNFHNEDIEVYTDNWHEHHTVCFSAPITYTDETNQNSLYIPFITKLSSTRGKIFSLIDEIIFTHTVHTKGDITCMGLVLQLLDEINRHNRQTLYKSSYQGHKYVKGAKKYIFEHLSEPISQMDIAKHLDISPEYLCSIFKSSENTTIMQFINRIKLEQIRNLMQNSGFTLAKSCELYGYSDPNYVSRLYKKYFNGNITDFKKNM